MVTIRTTAFNSQKLCIQPTQCIHVSSEVRTECVYTVPKPNGRGNRAELLARAGNKGMTPAGLHLTAAHKCSALCTHVHPRCQTIRRHGCAENLSFHVSYCSRLSEQGQIIVVCICSFCREPVTGRGHFLSNSFPFIRHSPTFIAISLCL
jgi:hypothetical protein